MTVRPRHPAPRVFVAEQVRAAIDMDLAVECIRQSFAEVAGGRAINPAVWELDVPPGNGQVHVKGAVIEGIDRFAIKAASGFPDNSARGLPTADGFTAVFETATGRLVALLLDEGYLTDLRTGAAGAVALDLLGPRTVATLAVVGTGAQAPYQIDGALCVRDIEHVVIRGRSLSRAQDLADWVRRKHDVKATAELHSTDDVIDADAIVTATTATSPVLLARQVRPGTHISAVGSDTAGKRELEPALLESADVVAVDVLSQSLSIGELQGLDVRRFRFPPRLLGEFVGGDMARGRRDVTVADLSGTGVQDCAIAHVAMAQLDGHASSSFREVSMDEGAR